MVGSKKMNAGHDSRAIANIFVDKAQTTADAAHPLTIMSLLKYVYFAHGWMLGHTGNNLICHKLQAWRYGPVVPEVYHAFSHQGTYIVQKEEKYNKPSSLEDLLPMERDIVSSVYEEYSKLPTFRLSAITHSPGTPWYRYRHTYYGEIPNDAIKEYYEELVKKLSDDE